MEIKLFPHNQETYDKIIKSWQTQNKVATVQATGTGKTFLILKCIFTYPEIKKVIFAPSNHILDQFLERIDENGLPNTTLLTYAKLSFMSPDEIEALSPEMIVLDEFHRVGAEQWGTGVQTLISLFPESKLLGTTATPIRHLDKGRDMSDELFEGNVVTNLSLPQAIVKGILPMPKYISALYTFQDEILNLQNKIKKASNEESEKVDMLATLKELKTKLNKSKGVPVILKKHLKDQTGKFIVFCKDSKHLEKMKPTVEGWFKKAKLGKEVESYTVLSGMDKNDETLKMFVGNKNNDNIVLLFSVDMLNEGLHVEDVTGVILLRPTTSSIIYFQQIGRALQAGNSNTPFVFDLVNNFSSLGSQTFQEELRQATREENEWREQNGTVGSGGKGKLDIDQFELFDEVQEINEMFGEIEGRLTDVWDVMFEKWKNGDWDENDKKMVNWVITQRSKNKQKTLTTERKERLTSLGFIWDDSEYRWNLSFDKLKKYKDKYGHSDISLRHELDGVKIGQWVVNQRRLFKENKLSGVRINKLNSIKFCWDANNGSWMKSFDCWVEYKKQNGNSFVARNCEIDGIKLGTWVNNQRTSYRKKNLSLDRIEKLNSIGFPWNPKRGKPKSTNTAS